MGPRRPIVAKTAVSASSSGTPAATRAPKAISRMISVTGRDVISALPKSDWTLSLICCWVLASPNSPTVNAGCAFCTSSTAASAGFTRSMTSASFPAIWKRRNAERWSAEIWLAFAGTSGLSKFCVWGTAASRRCVSSSTARKDGSEAVVPRCSESAPAPVHAPEPRSQSSGPHGPTPLRRSRCARGSSCRPRPRSRRRGRRRRASPRSRSCDAARSIDRLLRPGCGE